MSITTLKQYIQNHSSNVILSSAAFGVMLRVQDKPFAENIRVIEQDYDLLTLEKGYYLRFLDRGEGAFHVFGVEVLEQGNLLIHENIPRQALNKHCDDRFKSQLQALHRKGKVLFRVANEAGGGAALHEDLAVKYATDGIVGLYNNSKLSRGDDLPSSLEDILKPSEVDSSILSEESFESAQSSNLSDNASKSPSASMLLNFGAGVLAAAGVASLIIGALALAAIITVISPPVALALTIGGGVAIASGLVKLGMFSSNKSEPDEIDEKLNSSPELKI